MSPSIVDLDPVSPFWEISEGRFLRDSQLDSVRSAEGQRLARRLGSPGEGIQVFLRGSLLECAAPFERADADLFVLYDQPDQLRALSNLLPEGYSYDIKAIPRSRMGEDFVYYALLHCRSLQIGGPPLAAEPVHADKAFAWKHWVKYCPALIPGAIDTSSPTALIHFKLLTRCFGVLSFLRDRRFTREIGACIDFAETEEAGSAARLREIRAALEAQSVGIYPVGGIRKSLARRFDVLFGAWT
jgi:hypothetical protein